MARLTKFKVRIPDAPVKPASVSRSIIRQAVVTTRDARTGQFTEIVKDKSHGKARSAGARQK